MDKHILGIHGESIPTHCAYSMEEINGMPSTSINIGNGFYIKVLSKYKQFKAKAISNGLAMVYHTQMDIDQVEEIEEETGEDNDEQFE